jgi:hypothetical protein
MDSNSLQMPGNRKIKQIFFKARAWSHQQKYPEKFSEFLSDF